MTLRQQCSYTGYHFVDLLGDHPTNLNAEPMLTDLPVVDDVVILPIHFVSVENDIAVSSKELADLTSLNRYHIKVLNSPNLKQMAGAIFIVQPALKKVKVSHYTQHTASPHYKGVVVGTGQ